MQVTKDLEIKAYYAGHVLGAAMFLVKVGDQSVVYTVSDSSRAIFSAVSIFRHKTVCKHFLCCVVMVGRLQHDSGQTFRVSPVIV